MTAATVAQTGAAITTARQARNRPRPAASSPSRPARVATEGAGFLLALFVWGWVIMPLIHAGPTGVRDMLRAKFLNKAPDGSWLP